MEELLEVTAGDDRSMDDEERALAAQVYEAIQQFSRGDTRGQQSANFEVGISDLGWCSEKTRRMIMREEEPPTDVLPAFIGTAVGDHVEKAVDWSPLFPDWITQASVKVVLIGDRGQQYTVPGHPDMIDPAGKVIDTKAPFGLGVARRTGANNQQRFQKHLYALGAHEAGLFNDDVALEDVLVGNLWIDRSAFEKELLVHLEPFDMGVVHEAAQWLDEVVYAVRTESHAAKEPPREVCAATCGFFGVCRGEETDVTGLISDPETLAAMDEYMAASKMQSQGKIRQKAAKSILLGKQGSSGTHTLRTVHVDPTYIDGYERAGYDKVDIKPIKG